MRIPPLLFGFVVALFLSSWTAAQTLELELRYQEPTSKGSNNYHRLSRAEHWNPRDTAVIVCDMWDSHHCVNAVRRVAQLAPRIDQFCNALREQGATIIHAPSSCMAAYKEHPARMRAAMISVAESIPEDIDSWCDQIPSEEAAAYPLDQADGGEDDDPEDHRLWAERLAAIGRDPDSPWSRQVDVIKIDRKRDYISENGTEIWSVLERRKVANVILVGVHTNMCVLGRPFGLRRLSSGGKNVVLARDLTDTMVDPNAWPYANHFTGTDLIVSHIERYVCPTVSSDQILGGSEFRFAADQRPRLTMLIAEQEYETEKSLPAFAAKHLSKNFSVSICFEDESDRNKIVGIEEVAASDALLVSVRRRTLHENELNLIRRFVSQGKPVIGIRTASHAFSLRNKEPSAGLSDWPEFDADVFGGSYSNHFGNKVQSTLSMPSALNQDMFPVAAVAVMIQPGGSLYKAAPLAAGSTVLLEGSIEGGSPEPVAWKFIRNDGGRSFYTSLGHPDDFAQPEFETLLVAGIHWACGLEPTGLDEIKQQNARYSSGRGRQRK